MPAKVINIDDYRKKKKQPEQVETLGSTFSFLKLLGPDASDGLKKYIRELEGKKDDADNR